MSLHNDSRQYGSDEERAEWKAELRREYEEHQPDYPEEPTHYCEECEYFKGGRKFVHEIVTREVDGKPVLHTKDDYCYMDVCVKDIEDIREVHCYDEVCDDHGELCDMED